MARKKQLTWDFANEPIPRSAIAELEKELGITLPEDYVRCALRNHGGSPSRMAYDMPDEKGKVFNSLLSLKDSEADDDEMSIREVYSAIKRRLPKGVYPIARDPFGNYICFDYRDATGPPVIVFWNHEESGKRRIRKICNSFTELLDSLYDDE